jgi:hypothetical protein
MHVLHARGGLAKTAIPHVSCATLSFSYLIRLTMDMHFYSYGNVLDYHPKLSKLPNYHQGFVFTEIPLKLFLPL